MGDYSREVSQRPATASAPPHGRKTPISLKWIRRLSRSLLQVHLNNLAKEFSDSIVRYAFSNIRTIFRTKRKMKFVTEDPAEDLLMPATQTVQRPKTQPELILKLIDAMPHPRDRALLAVGCFCGPRTSESLGPDLKVVRSCS